MLSPRAARIRNPVWASESQFKALSYQKLDSLPYAQALRDGMTRQRQSCPGLMCCIAANNPGRNARPRKSIFALSSIREQLRLAKPAASPLPAAPHHCFHRLAHLTQCFFYGWPLLNFAPPRREPGTMLQRRLRPESRQQVRHKESRGR